MPVTASWKLSKPQAHCTDPAPKTKAPELALYLGEFKKLRRFLCCLDSCERNWTWANLSEIEWNWVKGTASKKKGSTAPQTNTGVHGCNMSSAKDATRSNGGGCTAWIKASAMIHNSLHICSKSKVKRPSLQVQKAYCTAEISRMLVHTCAARGTARGNKTNNNVILMRHLWSNVPMMPEQQRQTTFFKPSETWLIGVSLLRIETD